MSDWREGVAEILEAVARDGLPEPRSLDVALDAIGCEVEAALAAARKAGAEDVAKEALQIYRMKYGASLKPATNWQQKREAQQNVVVPREPTEAMVKAALDIWMGEDDVRYVWEKMTEAAEKEKNDA